MREQVCSEASELPMERRPSPGVFRLPWARCHADALEAMLGLDPETV
jgi:hypothetical protein